MLPLALASPVAGVLVDRLDRRRVMIGSDFLRAVIVLGFLFVDSPGMVWLLFVLTAAQVTVTAAFQPAKSAVLPNITSERELLTANALLSATWSTMLALGAAAGGAAVQWLGPQAVFVLDSATYLVSAWFIARMRIPQETAEAAPGVSVVRDGVEKIVEGWRRMRARPEVGRMALAKATWGVGGGGLVFLLALLGEAVLPLTPALGIGVLFAARGLGTGLGPVLARSWFTDQRAWPAVLGGCIILSGLGYVGIGLVPWAVALVFGLVLVAHAASGANWVLSTVLLQQRTEDRFRGRVFATDWLFVTLVESASIAVAGVLLEGPVAGDLRAVVVAFGAVQALTGIGWLLTVVPAERRTSAAG